jgi:hypothetical protein
MWVVEALRISITEPHDHPHIKQDRADYRHIFDVRTSA